MRVACYARVSTHDQQTLPLQLKAMEDYANRREWSVCQRISEVGSGKDDSRPKRDAILKKARRREIDAILVWKLDRWGRSVVDLVSTLQELVELKVGFVSLTEAVDLTTPAGKALTGLLAVFAEFEREILRERIKAGIAQSRKNGKPHGRPRSAMTKTSEVRELHAQGLSKSKISRRLGIGRTSVRRILSLPCSSPEQSSLKELQALLWLEVCNNNKFVRGKSRVRRDIEDFILPRYNAKRLSKDGLEYHLTVPYKDEKELDTIMDDILQEMENTADNRHCFTEASISDRNSDRVWD